MTKREARLYCRKEWAAFLKGDGPCLLKEHLRNYLKALEKRARLLIYAPLADEIDYLDIFADFKSYSFEFYAPRVSQTSMEFRLCDSNTFSSWKWNAGYKNIPGPAKEAPLFDLLWRDSDRVVVPVLGLSKDGSRLGRGGGYYDRWYANLGKSALQKQELAASCRQRVSRQSLALAPAKLARLSFPVETFDMRLQAAISEEGLLYYPCT